MARGRYPASLPFGAKAPSVRFVSLANFGKPAFFVCFLSEARSFLFFSLGVRTHDALLHFLSHDMLLFSTKAALLTDFFQVAILLFAAGRSRRSAFQVPHSPESPTNAVTSRNMASRPLQRRSIHLLD